MSKLVIPPDRLPSAQRAWDRVSAAMGLAPSDVRTGRVLEPRSRWERIRLWHRWEPLVGLVLLLVRIAGIGGGSVLLARTLSEQSAARRMAVHAAGADSTQWTAPTGAPRHVVLFDGSTAELTPGTTFGYRVVTRVWPTLGKRATLRGEADLDVSTSAGAVLLYGDAGHLNLRRGRYHVRSTRDSMLVTVLDGFGGTLAGSAGPRVQLGRGTTAAVARGGAPSVVNRKPTPRTNP